MSLTAKEAEIVRKARICCEDTGVCEDGVCDYTDVRDEGVRFCRQWMMHDLLEIIDRFANEKQPDGRVIIERDGGWTKATVYHQGSWRAIKIPTHCNAWSTYLESIEAAARNLVSELIEDDEDGWRYSLACAGD